MFYIDIEIVYIDIEIVLPPARINMFISAYLFVVFGHVNELFMLYHIFVMVFVFLNFVNISGLDCIILMAFLFNIF